MGLQLRYKDAQASRDARVLPFEPILPCCHGNPCHGGDREAEESRQYCRGQRTGVDKQCDKVKAANIHRRMRTRACLSPLTEQRHQFAARAALVTVEHQPAIIPTATIVRMIHHAEGRASHASHTILWNAAAGREAGREHRDSRAETIEPEVKINSMIRHEGRQRTDQRQDAGLRPQPPV